MSVAGYDPFGKPDQAVQRTCPRQVIASACSGGIDFPPFRERGAEELACTPVRPKLLPHPADEFVRLRRILRGEIHMLRHADTLYADSSVHRPYRVALKTSRIFSVAGSS